MPGVKLIYDTTCTSTSDTSCSWTVPAGVTSLTFEIWGGGGGGGNQGTNCDCCQRGGPGSGGGYSRKTITTAPGCVYNVVAGRAGVSSQGYGSYCGTCCDGCTGGTSYVTGYGLTNFCATGGAGGKSNFETSCYAHCGCNFCSQTPGCGYGGDIVARGFWGSMAHYGSTPPCYIYVWGGAAGGPGGGYGGQNRGHCSFNCYCAAIGEHNFHGRVPGGGGTGSGGNNCCCTPYPSGRGGPGVVKISY